MHFALLKLGFSLLRVVGTSMQADTTNASTHLSISLFCWQPAKQTTNRMSGSLALIEFFKTAVGGKCNPFDGMPLPSGDFHNGNDFYASKSFAFH
jgi:hypothetical protein